MPDSVDGVESEYSGGGDSRPDTTPIGNGTNSGAVNGAPDSGARNASLFENPSGDTERIAPASGAAPRKRGRPPGSRNRAAVESGEPAAAIGSAAETGAENKNGLNGFITFKLDEALISLNLMAATLTKSPELAITKDEAKQLADNIRDVAKYHQISIDPKKAAYVQLSICVGSIYVPRVVKIWRRKFTSNAAPIATGPAPASNSASSKPNGAPPPPTQSKVDLSKTSPSMLFGSESGGL